MPRHADVVRLRRVAVRTGFVQSGRTQRAFCLEIRLPETVVSDYTTGSRRCPREIAEALARFINVPLEQLLDAGWSEAGERRPQDRTQVPHPPRSLSHEGPEGIAAARAAEAARSVDVAPAAPLALAQTGKLVAKVK